MNFSEQLKSQLSIVDVVQQYVRLKRQGNGLRYVGLCPFHSEKTPSFGVHSGLGYYKCFGCDASGDVFKFVQEMESLTFPETLKVLADRYGIPMPERQRSDHPEEQKRAALQEMHETAADLFQDNLRGAAGALARKYLESRNVFKAAMDEFRIGLAMDSWDQLTQRLQRFGPQLMAESGLVKPRDGGGFYDIFRDRIMFPIHNEAGKLIGFGGRALSKEVPQKYLNSPETLLYKKSSVLYNLHRAKVDARKNDRMILVEGYMDVIGIYSAGIREVVAISGTAMATDQVRAIKRQVAHQQAARGEVVLNLDPDAAGTKSTEKHIATFLAEGLRVRVLEIPGGLDPDEYIQQAGVDEYRKLLQSAASYFHWLADRARTRFDMRTPEGRVDAFQFLWPSIQQVADRLERSAIARDVADYLNVDRELVMQKYKGSPKAQNSAPSRPISAALPPNERLLLSALLASGDARAAVRHYMASSAHFPLLEARDIFEAVLGFDEDGEAFSMEAISTRLSERSRRILSEIGFGESALEEESAAGQALHCLRALEAKAISVQMDTLRRRIRELEAAGNMEGALSAMAELNRLKKGHPA
jgi:DNA primase